jgi:hypothetical protein
MSTKQANGFTPTAADQALTRNPYLPVNLEERAKEKAFYREQQRINRPRLLDCLDPTVAKRYEDAKPMFSWKVECGIFRKATPKTHAHVEQVQQIVVAQNENDAWSSFCDIQGEWPSRRDSNPTITRLKKHTLRDNAEGTED